MEAGKDVGRLVLTADGLRTRDGRRKRMAERTERVRAGGGLVG